MTYLHKRSYNPKRSTFTKTCYPFILTYSPAFRSTSSIIRKHMSILTISNHCHNIFKPAAIVTFRRSNNLTNFLVRAKLRKPFTKSTPPPPPPPQEVLFNVLVTVLCAPTYQTDLLVTHSTPQAKQVPGISHHITCNSKNLSLHDSVQTLSQAIYKRLTKTRLKGGFNEHRRPVNKPTNISKPTTVSEHFPTDHHTTNDISPIPLKLVLSNRDNARKAREAYLITRGNTLHPLGLTKDEM